MHSQLWSDEVAFYVLCAVVRDTLLQDTGRKMQDTKHTKHACCVANTGILERDTPCIMRICIHNGRVRDMIRVPVSGVWRPQTVECRETKKTCSAVHNAVLLPYVSTGSCLVHQLRYSAPSSLAMIHYMHALRVSCLQAASHSPIAFFFCPPRRRPGYW